jgi:hypothetical protein
MPAPKQRSATKHDVALAEVNRKAARELTIIRYAGTALIIAVVALLLWVGGDHVVQPVAGKTTKVDVSFVMTISIAVSLVLNAAQYDKGRRQRKELQRQRELISELEGGNDDAL